MFEIPEKRQMIAGIGSALVDILIHEDDEFISKTQGKKGGMTYVDKQVIDHTLSASSASPVQVPGGSACNTIIGIGKLGGSARFMGKCGSGPMAALFETSLKENHVDPFLFKSPSLTGRVLSIVTPDAQRSMLTFLGASAEIQAEDISVNSFEETGIVHVEGYLLFNQSLITAALDSAQKAGARISLDLASFTVVQESREFLESLVDQYVDILIANEDEAREFTGISDEKKALEHLAEKAEIAVLKLGERGSMIAYNGEMIRINPVKDSGDVVDTTGAGDLWASGFLFGLVKGFSMEKSGALGSLCGYEVCRSMGAKISESGWSRILQSL